MTDAWSHSPATPVPGATKVVWAVGRPLCEFAMRTLYHARWHGREHLMHAGPTIIVANHQSLLDPIIIGILTKPIRYRPIARKTLFRNPIMATTLRAFNVIPLDQERGDRAAIAAGIEAVESGHPLVIYPEGSRTPDGTVQEFQRGFMLILKKTKARIVPVAIEGAFDAWPMHRSLPRLYGRIEVEAAPPISYEKATSQKAAVFMAQLQSQIETMRQRLRRRIDAAAT